MANTYTLISSNVLSTATASVTFSAIPATYTDLVLKTTARADSTSLQDIEMTWNGINTTGYYSQTWVNGEGGALTSTAKLRSLESKWQYANIWGNNGTTNSFSISEIYIPNYAGTALKPASIVAVNEKNTSTVGEYQIRANALLGNFTSAITSITISLPGNNFVSGSSFYLYGIKNS